MDFSIIKEFFIGLWAFVFDNPEVAGVVVTVLIAALSVGWTFAMWIAKAYFAKPKDTTETDTIKLFIESKEREIEMLTTKLTDASFDKGQLYRQIDELKRQLAEPEKAMDEALKRNADLAEQLDALRGRYDPNRIAAAKDAMDRFDYDAAEALFQQMRDDTADAVKMQADAEYGLGEIAEARVDWPAAAQHYDHAADLDPTIETLDKAGEFLWRNGQYGLAEARYHRVLSLVAAEHGVDHKRYGAALNDLALVYLAQGLHKLAEHSIKQAIEIARRMFGDDHPGFAVHLNTLALVYRAQGCYDKAEKTYKNALEIGCQANGTDNPAFAIRLNNLAMVYHAQGRFDLAEKTYIQALEIDRRTIGEDHPSFSIRLNNLALVFDAQSRDDLAEATYKQAIDIDRRSIGEDHPRFANHLNNLAGLYRKTERYAEAVPLLEQAVGIFTDRFPAGHLNVVDTQKKLDFCREKLAGVE